MYNVIKQLFKKDNKDIRKRVYFTLIALFIFTIGTGIGVPGTSANELMGDSGGILDLMNIMSGGGLKQFSILALGVMPYITASIIVQLLQMDVVPTLTEWSKQGEFGRRKINQLTRYLGIFLAFVQGYGYAFTFNAQGLITVRNGGPLTYIGIAIILTAGTSFLLWLGDQITQKGIGNGISLIIMAGIVSRLPFMFGQAFDTLFDRTTTQSMFIGVVSFVLFILMYLLIIVGVIFVQEAIRKVPIQYANRTHSAYGGGQSYMPIKLNSAGVIPVIFASSILAAPVTIASFFPQNNITKWITLVFDYTNGAGLIMYIALIIAFAYFYTFMQINPQETAENLQSSGGYIPGVRPGDETQAYIKRVLTRLTFVGAIFIAVIAGTPIIFTKISTMPTSVQIGGTGLLIVVGVALETFKQLEGQLIGRNYQGYISK